MECGYFDAGRCRSCTLLEQPYPRQLADKQALAEAAVPGAAWDAPFASAERRFRNKAKMAVAGTTDAPTLGILGADGRGIDLAACPLHEVPIEAAMEPLRCFIALAALTPYAVPERRGELKHLLVTASPDGELMVRFVVRSTEALPRIRKHLDALRRELPALVVASASILPQHKAAVEGELEVPLTEQQSLVMRLGDVPLVLRPGGFFQTNSSVATALYRQAADWIDGVAPASVTDLYCGVGGFALFTAREGRTVTGIESSEEAVAGARHAARATGSRATFEAGDAAEAAGLDADAVIVNPPRRGIGALAGRLETASARHVLYSSCNPATLARDLAAMPSLRPVRARVFDMFPHNRHAEVLVLLERRAS